MNDTLMRKLREHKCKYCPNDLADEIVRSPWVELDYKVVKCDDCHKKNWVKVNFFVNDSSNPFKEDSSLESTVRMVRER
ncbi:hypothetical protein HYX11_03635 [Candidatus Woesearchaeota archaeon]|nr:hypothetical protein [Candidatus Woesearchaeota archaeon]